MRLILCIVFLCLCSACENDTQEQLWTSSYTPTSVDSYVIVSAQNGDLFAGTLSGVFKSVNGGRAWNYDEKSHDLGLTLLSLAVDDDENIYVGRFSSGAVWKKRNNDSAWYYMGAVGWHAAVNHMTCVSNGVMYFSTSPERTTGTSGSGLWVTRDSGRNFANISKGLRFDVNINGVADSSVFQLVRNPAGRLIVGTSDGLFLSDNEGNTWMRSQGIPAGTKMIGIATSAGNVLYASGNGIYKSDDNGTTWTGLRSDIYGEGIVSSANGFVCTGNSNGNIYISYDYGKTWNENNIVINYPNTYPAFSILLDRDNYLWVAISGAGGILRSQKQIK